MFGSRGLAISGTLRCVEVQFGSRGKSLFVRFCFGVLWSVSAVKVRQVTARFGDVRFVMAVVASQV